MSTRLPPSRLAPAERGRALPDERAAGPAPVVQLSSVSKTYALPDGGSVEVLRDVDFRLRPGEHASLVGPSGSGKSTLLSLVAGLLTPTSGTVAIDGTVVSELDDAGRARLRALRIGIALQADNLVPFLSARENVELAASLGGQPRRQARAKARELLELFGVLHRAERRPRHLSGGEAQRVALAVALANDPAILLADEVVAQLDADTAGAVLGEVLQGDLAVLLVTHDRDLAAHMATRYELRDHRLELSPPVAPPSPVEPPSSVELVETRPSTPGAAILTDRLVVDYPGPLRTVRALDCPGLTVVAGSSVAIMGPSGCGKSTLLGLLAGLAVPTEGSVSVGGEVISALPEGRRLRFRRGTIGMVYQADNLLPHLTVEENIGLPLALVSGRRSQTDALVADLLGRLGLEQLAGRFPDQLSGGQRQRVAVARAVAHRPRVLLADEPTGALDEHSARSVVELLMDVQRQFGATLVLVTHDPVAAAYVDWVELLVPAVEREAAQELEASDAS